MHFSPVPLIRYIGAVETTCAALYLVTRTQTCNPVPVCALKFLNTIFQARLQGDGATDSADMFLGTVDWLFASVLLCSADWPETSVFICADKLGTSVVICADWHDTSVVKHWAPL